jgi:RNA recognition motif-containing protein
MRSRSDKDARYHKEVSNTLYVGNLGYDTNEEIIEKTFE